jgi:hypothetical protein
MDSYWNRWDIVSAYYAYYTDWHTGQASYEFARLCRIRRYFNPGPYFDGYASLTENGEAIYDELAASQWESL